MDAGTPECILVGIPTATPAPATRPLPRADRREAILRGAATAFARTGFAGTSMEHIAAASGITKLIVYRHFDSKEELYRAVLQRVFDRQAELFVAAVGDGLRPGTSVGLVVRVAREYPDGFRLLWRHAAREPAFARYAEDLRHLAVQATRELLAPAAPAVPLEWGAATVYDLVIGAVLNWLDLGDAARDDELVDLTTLALHGVVGAWTHR